jgi:hypothetical protein
MAQQDNHNLLDPEIKKLAEEIADYLSERDSAADTIDGITRWWLLQQRLIEARRRVVLAMNYLYEKGLVTARTLPDGETLYASIRKNSSEQ